MKIYKKDKGKFLYSKTANVEYYIREIIEIKPNIIVLFLQKRLGSGCIVYEFNYYISLYNIENDEKNLIGQRIDYIDDDYYNTKPFLKINDHLIAKYADYLDIYDIDHNMESINKNDYKIIKSETSFSDKESKILKYEVPFICFKEKLNNNYILATNQEGKSFIYKYEDKSFKECQEFPYHIKDANIIKLKNDKLIINYRNEFKIINLFY